MKIIRGTVPCALKVCIDGPEGIGKSTFASRFPNPVFIDTEGSTAHMDLARTPRPQSFTALKEQIRYFIDHTEELDTLVIDTADWAERLLMEEICAQRKIKSIEDLGYGKGYTLLMEEFGKLLNLLDELLMRGVHVVFTAHAMMRKFEQPDELGQYDRWELKLQKKTAPLLKEWADLLLFANYKTTVVNVDNQGAAKGKNKAQGGRRVMYTTHHSCWDAKNRFGLADELPFEFEQIAGIMPPVAKLCDVRRQADAPGGEARAPSRRAADRKRRIGPDCARTAEGRRTSALRRGRKRAGCGAAGADAGGGRNGRTGSRRRGRGGLLSRSDADCQLRAGVHPRLSGGRMGQRGGKNSGNGHAFLREE